MIDWMTLLKRLRSKPKGIFPLDVYTVHAPTGEPFPRGLPLPAELRDFYAICDGGDLDQYCWFRRGELAEKTRLWCNRLHNYDERGDVLHPQRHLVFAKDSAGAPVIWDSSTDAVATFYWKGGDWELWAASMQDFLANLFEPPPDNEMWFQAVCQLQDL